MSLFSRRPAGPTVRGRALVVPSSTGNVGSGSEDGNFNNFTAKSRAKSATRLVAVSAEDGGPVPSDSQRVICDLPNWVRMVMHDAGTNDGQHAHLPAEIHVPVLIDVASRTIVALDVDATAAELEPYREVGTREWKETEAVLAPVRNAVKLPGVVAREVPSTLKSWKKAVTDLREDLRPNAPMRDEPLSANELEQQRRTANQLKYVLERDPKQYGKVRESALQAGPQMAQGVAAGSYPRHAFAAWLVFQETSGVITPQEVAALRLTAGLE